MADSPELLRQQEKNRRAHATGAREYGPVFLVDMDWPESIRVIATDGTERDYTPREDPR